MNRIVTRGYGPYNMIVTRGYGSGRFMREIMRLVSRFYTLVLSSKIKLS